MATFREVFGNFLTNWGGLLSGGLADAERERFEGYGRQSQYYAGQQPKQIRVRGGKEDDNVTLNLTRKVIDKSAHMLVGGEVEFDFGDNEEVEQYIEEIYEANHKPVMLLNSAKTAGKHGTGYIQILPDYYDEGLPRLERLHPNQMTILVDQEDIGTVLGYRQEYNIVRDGKEVGRRRDTILERLLVEDAGEEVEDLGTWMVRDFETVGGKWVQTNAVDWPYDWPPVIHWQNMATDESTYGLPDVSEDLLELQDKINYNASKIGRIIRYHSHPRLWGKGFAKGSQEKKSWGEDDLIVIGQDGEIHSVEMQSDLVASMEYLNSLTQQLYDLSSTANLNTVKDKLGQLTNFGLRVLYQDALEKLYGKRLTFGGMLVELNRRLLEMSGKEPLHCEVVWPQNVLPQNQLEEANLLTVDMANGLVSKETARGLRGYDNEKELERLDGETEDLGSLIVNALNRGQ